MLWASSSRLALPGLFYLEVSGMDLQRWDRAKELVGNTFELTALIQKRCRELVKEKQRKLVDLESRNPIQIALEEVLQGKIHLAPPPPTPVLETADGEVAPAAAQSEVAPPPPAIAPAATAPQEQVEAKID
jgi:DNA-directed RNA polymerase subunit K/omega